LLVEAGVEAYLAVLEDVEIAFPSGDAGRSHFDAMRATGKVDDGRSLTDEATIDVNVRA
jgi:hypothetical protein